MNRLTDEAIERIREAAREILDARNTAEMREAIRAIASVIEWYEITPA